MAGAAQDSAQEEQRLEHDLEHLKELHVQLMALRSAVPQMMEPLLAPRQPTPQAEHSTFMAAVKGAQEAITRFKDTYTSEESDAIFMKASDSRQANPLGIRPWRASDDPDWTRPRGAAPQGG